MVFKSKERRRYTVLFVEDDADLIQSYTETFRDTFDIRTTDSGVKAVQFATEQDDIDAVVLDYKLPDISGLEVLKELKETKTDLPVILVTGYGSEEIAVKSFLNGCRDYLKKPFSTDELFSKIVCCIHSKYQSQANRKQRLLQKTNLRAISSVINQDKLSKAIEYIHAQYPEKINIDMIANIAGMSERHFSRLFREAFNTTFRDYLIEYRLEKSQEMLEKTTLSITEISFSVGFFDLTHFSRMFKKKYGCNPQQYRRSVWSNGPAC